MAERLFPVYGRVYREWRCDRRHRLEDRGTDLRSEHGSRRTFAGILPARARCPGPDIQMEHATCLPASAARCARRRAESALRVRQASDADDRDARSEERRVGKEVRLRWAADDELRQ